MTPPALSRRRRGGSYRAEDIVDIAVGVFLDRGYDGTSMADLAEAAGVTKASFYHHVAGKEELFERGTTRALDALFAVLEEPEARRGAALGRIRHIIRRTVEVIARHRPEVALLVRARGNTPTEESALARRRDFDRALIRLVRRAIREGDLHPGCDPRLFTRLALGTAVSVVEWYRPEGELVPDQLIDAVEAFIFSSPLVATGARSRARA